MRNGVFMANKKTTLPAVLPGNVWIRATAMVRRKEGRV